MSRRFVDASVANEAAFSHRFTISSGHFLARSRQIKAAKDQRQRSSPQINSTKFH
jgi:hypothetical protein